MTGSEGGTPTSSFGGLILIVVGAAACEASVTASAAYAMKPLLGASIMAWLLAFGLTCLAALPLALPLGGLLDTAAVRRLGTATTAGLGGDRPRSSVALSMLLVTLAAALLVGMRVGNVLTQRLSPSFAAAGTSAAMLLTLLVGIATAAWLGQWLGRFVDFGLAKVAWSGRIQGLLLVVVLAGVLTCTAVALGLGKAYAALPAGSIAALALFLSARVRRRIDQWVSTTRRGALITLGLFVICLPAAVFPSVAPPSAQGAVLFKAPYLSVLLANAERLADGDGDGYAPILLGKDCDDDDPKVHPGASEVPSNGIDEDCSGGDVEKWQPIQAPTASRPSQLPDKVNVLLIMVDALRPDRLHFAGYERPTSPNLDRFRERATWFKNAFTAAPQTRDALASAFTGNYPFHIGIRSGSSTHTLPDKALTFAEVLEDEGYRNIGYTITYVDKRFRNYQQGFQSFAPPWGSKSWSFEWKRAAPLTTKAGLEQLESLSPDEPWLMFLHYRCTHDPYYKHEKDFGNDDSDKYDSALHHCDDQIARVLDAADARRDVDRTAIVIFSDHGELFGEHGGHYHGETLFEPDARIVLLAKVPGSDKRTVETPVSLADLAPTVMSLGGAKVPDRVDGWSLLPLLFDAAVDPAWTRRPLFVTTDLNRAGIHYTAAAAIDFPFKYIWDMRTGMKELYDVVTDPLERSPLADLERTSQMAELLERWLASHAPKRLKAAMKDPREKRSNEKRKKVKKRAEKAAQETD